MTKLLKQCVYDVAPVEVRWLVLLLLDTCYLELRALSARYMLKLLLSVKIALTMA